MKVSMMESCEMLERVDTKHNISVFSYRATHKNRSVTEIGIAVVLLDEDGGVIDCKCPIIQDKTLSDRFVIDPTTKALRASHGADGFMKWLRWYVEEFPSCANNFLQSILQNKKIFCSNLTPFVRDKIEGGWL